MEGELSSEGEQNVFNDLIDGNAFRTQEMQSSGTDNLGVSPNSLEPNEKKNKKRNPHKRNAPRQFASLKQAYENYTIEKYSEDAGYIGELKLFICKHPECGKTFSEPSNLKKHISTHGNKQFTCPLDGCKKSFLDNSKLSRHMLVHTREKPYKCEMCGKKFSLDFNLRTHLRTHTGEKPYFCRYHGCKKRFTQSSNLTAHEKTHFHKSGDPPPTTTPEEERANPKTPGPPTEDTKKRGEPKSKRAPGKERRAGEGGKEEKTQGHHHHVGSLPPVLFSFPDPGTQGMSRYFNPDVTLLFTQDIPKAPMAVGSPALPPLSVDIDNKGGLGGLEVDSPEGVMMPMEEDNKGDDFGEEEEEEEDYFGFRMPRCLAALEVQFQKPLFTPKQIMQMKEAFKIPQFLIPPHKPLWKLHSYDNNPL